MASKTAIRMAVPIHPPYIAINKVNDREVVKGSPLVHHALTLFEKAGFNLSFVPVSGINIGVANENGTYDGLWGAVQSGNADTTFYGAPSTIPQRVGRVTPVLVSTDGLMFSKREMSKEMDGSLYDCLTTLGFTINVILLTLILGTTLLLIKFLSRQAIRRFFSMIIKQSFIRINNRILMLTLTLTVLLVGTLFGCQYSTDVTVSAPVRNIDTLNDLLKSDKQPVCLRMDFQVDDFKQGLSETYAQVYRKIQNDPENTLDVGSINKLIAFLETRVLIVSKHYVTTAVEFYCSYPEFREKVKKDKVRLYISKPFSSTPIGLLSSRNASEQITRKLDRIAMRWLEHSLFGTQWETAAGEFLNSKQPQCVNEARKPVQDEPGQTSVTMKFVAVKELLYICSIAFMYFLLELVSAFRIFP